MHVPVFEPHLSTRVALAIVAGPILGQVAPGVVGALAGLEYGSINFVVAVPIRLMVYPMMAGGISPRSPASMNAPGGRSSP